MVPTLSGKTEIDVRFASSEICSIFSCMDGSPFVTEFKLGFHILTERMV